MTSNARLLAATLTLAAFAVTVSLACSQKPPEQAISFHNGILNISISDQWQLQRDSGKKAYYKHALTGVKLTFEDQTSDFGAPMTVQGVRSVIGSELNLRYGGVNARLGYGGNAVLSYERQIEEGRNKIHTQNWVVAHPLGYGAIARVAITLKVADGEQGTAEFEAIVQALDTQVGDAKMPEA